MRPLASIAALLLAACSHPQGAGAIQGAMAPPGQFLLESAAADFRAHGPPGPLRFRDVRLGRLPGDDGGHDILCGAFQQAQPGGDTRWTPFVTIRTSGYEQMLGDQADTFCRRAALAEGDLSPALQGRLEAVR
jgi:hypothetical protein